MAPPDRPLSPHLQVYRWQITMVMSILHRITGVFLAFGAFGLALMLLQVSRDATHPSQPLSQDVFFLAAQAVENVLLYSYVGLFLSLAFVWSLVYHMLNGIRHLIWDAGKGFEIKRATTSGWVVVVLSLALTIGLVLALFLGMS